MTTFKQGDVLLVPFPFTEQSTTKQRPAVVLSSEAYNLIHPDVILTPVTSQISRRPDEVALSNWPEAGLLKPSNVPQLSAHPLPNPLHSPNPRSTPPTPHPAAAPPST